MKKLIQKSFCSLLLLTCFSGCGATQTENDVQVLQEQLAFPETPQEALARLEINNFLHLDATANPADISASLRESTANDGQTPYAVVLTCSDSRVVPEHIFMEGLGSIFTVRNAGNVVEPVTLGSIEYGVEHLGASVILVLGHTCCGAVDATISEGGHGNILAITHLISAAIDGETEPTKAQILNVENSILQLQSSEIIADLVEEGKVILVGGIYDAHSGEVQFLD